MKRVCGEVVVSEAGCSIYVGAVNSSTVPVIQHMFLLQRK